MSDLEAFSSPSGIDNSRVKYGAPDIPQAQLVYSIEKSRWGVAIKGGKYICQLPREYAGMGLELAMTGEGIIVIHPDHPPLLINPNNGTTRPL